jgi:hypothetical protein
MNCRVLEILRGQVSGLVPSGHIWGNQQGLWVADEPLFGCSVLGAFMSSRKSGNLHTKFILRSRCFQMPPV